VTAAADAAVTAAGAETARSKQPSVIGAALAAALLAGCGGSKDVTYSLAPTADCLEAQGQQVGFAGNREDPAIITLEWADLRFHPSVAEAKAFDVSTLSTNFGGYEYHRKRYGNVSLIWATGGRDLAPPSSHEIETLERCLRT
jgi:hypothetical protein